MIPYEELVAALARWRARRGLPTGLGEYLGEPPGASAAFAAAYEPPVADHSADDVVELGGDLLDGSIDEALGDGHPPYSQEISLGEPLDDGDDLTAHSPDVPDAAEAMDLDDYGATAPEGTRPAGLAGLIATDDRPLDLDEPDLEPTSEARPPQAVARGRSRKRRR